MEEDNDDDQLRYERWGQVERDGVWVRQREAHRKKEGKEGDNDDDDDDVSTYTGSIRRSV